MTEFAFSGLGINPHYGTPLSPWDRTSKRIPGGSSSGTAVAVADGMVAAALGTDTGGSCRIPAAFCGVVGYKPTARRVPIGGVLPLAPSLDSVGPLAPSVACCAIIDVILAGEAPVLPKPVALAGLRLAVPENFVFDGTDAHVGAAFERRWRLLSELGVRIIHTHFATFDAIPTVNANGGFATAEAYAWHRALLAEKGAQIRSAYPLADRTRREAKRRRLSRSACRPPPSDYRIRCRHASIRRCLLPTTPIVPPRLAELEDEREYNRQNQLILRNTAVGNFLDRCAISLPCHRPGEPPVGLMLMGETLGDARLFSIAAAVEAALA